MMLETYSTCVGSVFFRCVLSSLSLLLKYLLIPGSVFGSLCRHNSDSRHGGDARGVNVITLAPDIFI